MKNKYLIIGIFAIGLELILLVKSPVGGVVATPTPTPTPTPVAGGWYYHNNTGTQWGVVRVDSVMKDSRGVVWSAQ